MPALYKMTLQKWYKKCKKEKYVRKITTGDKESITKKQHRLQNQTIGSTSPRVYLFCDEFTNYNDTEIGIKAIQLLEKLGYEVIIP